MTAPSSPSLKPYSDNYDTAISINKLNEKITQEDDQSSVLVAPDYEEEITTKPKSILLIDDQFLISSKLKGLTTKNLSGYTLDAPKSWRDIRDAILLNNFDIFIIDFRLDDFLPGDATLGDKQIADGIDIIAYLLLQEINSFSEISLYSRSHITYEHLNKRLNTSNHNVRIIEKAQFGTKNDNNVWLLRRMIDGGQFATIKHQVSIENFEALKSPSHDYMFDLVLSNKEERKTHGFVADQSYIIQSFSDKTSPKGENPAIELEIDYHKNLGFILALKISTPTEEIEIYNIDFPKEMLRIIKHDLRESQHPSWVKRLIKTTIVENLALWVVSADLQVFTRQDQENKSVAKESGIFVEYKDIEEVLYQIQDFTLQFSIALFKKYFDKIPDEDERNRKLAPWFELHYIPEIVGILDCEIIEYDADHNIFKVKMKSWQAKNEEPDTIGNFPKETLAQYGIEGEGAFFEYVTYINCDGIAKSHIIPKDKYPLWMKIG